MRLLPWLMCITLFVICEASNPNSNPSRLRTSTSTGTRIKRNNSAHRNTRGTRTWHQIQHNGASTSGGSSNTPRSTASVQECVDDKSPAEKCFDYFTLALFWAPGYAYKQSLRSTRIRSTITPKWVVHGLWPSMYDRNVPVPPRCNRTDIYFNRNRLSTNGLLGRLEITWNSIINNSGRSNIIFWEHEFIKHGNCASRSTAIRDVFNYFDKTLQLYNSLAIGTALSNARYREGSTDTLRNIINIIERQVGAKVKVDFVKNPNNNEHYLVEVFVCYNTQLTAVIDCPNAYRSPADLNKQIKYLGSVPRN